MYLSRYKPTLLYASLLLSFPVRVVSGFDQLNSPRSALPLLELNETDILEKHAPEPLSYWAHDFSDTSRHHRNLMAWHVLGMCFSFFCLLPAGIALRSNRHPWRSVTVVFFGIIAFLSSAAGSLYKKFTGDLYDNSVHGRHGLFVLGLFSVLAVCDALAFFQRIVGFLKDPEKRNIRVFWRSVIFDQGLRTDEYISLAHEEPGYTPGTPHEEISRRSQRTQFPGQFDEPSSSSARPSSNDSFHDSSESVASVPLSLNDPSHIPIHIQHESKEAREQNPHPRWAAIGSAIFAIAERSLLLLGLMQVMSGTAVYTGICRQAWIAGCIGHMIKGGITVCYGLVTFGRYLGLWSNLGWAWNRSPDTHNLTAEAMESLFFIFYGIVMTVTERVGTEPGPFTAIQIQHISIALMFFVAGMLGFALESKTLSSWLFAPAQACVTPGELVAQPRSYVGSFNPFPALVVGVTGVSISAHPQKYIFPVQLHALWGYLLAGFAVLRCLTYCFLWFRPPRSVLPSRPPTEALASFFLTCGGLLLILSTEQIEFAAMRRGHGDVMLFFNFAVAITYLAFLWVLIVVAFQGWLIRRSRLSLIIGSTSFWRRK